MSSFGSYGSRASTVTSWPTYFWIALTTNWPKRFMSCFMLYWVMTIFAISQNSWSMQCCRISRLLVEVLLGDILRRILSRILYTQCSVSSLLVSKWEDQRSLSFCQRSVTLASSLSYCLLSSFVGGVTTPMGYIDPVISSTPVGLVSTVSPAVLVSTTVWYWSMVTPEIGPSWYGPAGLSMVVVSSSSLASISAGSCGGYMSSFLPPLPSLSLF